MKVGWKKSRISAVCLEMEIQDIIIEEKALDDIPFKLVMSRKEELSDLLEKLSDKVGEILDACR